MNITAEQLRDDSFGLLDPTRGPTCPCCGNKSILVDSTFIYGKMITERKFWACSMYPECDCYVGTHARGEWKDYPLGSLADAELRQIRKKAHILFDALWNTKGCSRQDCYKWMQHVLKMEPEHAHIGELDYSQTSILITHLNQLYSQTILNLWT